MIGRRRSRSTQRPASRPKTRTGAEIVAASRPIWAGLAPSARSAVSWIAVLVICDPNFEIVWPVHSLRKSGCCHGLGEAELKRAFINGIPRCVDHHLVS